jgi:predicted transcriptional regulator YdeE
MGYKKLNFADPAIIEAQDALNQFITLTGKEYMKKELVNKPEIKLVGLTTRTNNKNEMNPLTSKIKELAGHFWSKNSASTISNRKNSGVTISVYTEYDSNEHGDYTYFIGEEVNSLENVAIGLQQLIIPAAKYQKFTTSPGKMPEVVIHAWQQIWEMSAEDLGGERAYVADFEVYTHNPLNSDTLTFSLQEVDIYIGIK